jgi:NADPH2:quinone reductase
MRAVVLSEFTDPASPQVVERDEPVAGEGQVLVELVAADLQPLDRQIARGGFPGAGPLPMIAGVSAVGRTADGQLHVVLAEMTGMGLHRDGCFAEKFVCEPRQLVAVPDGLDPVSVAAVSNAGMHARRALFDVANLWETETVLVLGASGAFGRAAVQIASAAGINVVAAARRIDAIPTATGAGTVTPIALGEPDDLPQQVLDATNGEGVNAVIDPLGGAFTGAAIRSSAPDAIHVLAGNQAGAMAPILVPMMLLREHTIVGLNGFRITEEEQHRLMEASLADQVSGVLTADIGAVFGLRDSVEAYQAVAIGRVVLTA